jgi:hypothetical protein
LNLPNIQDNVTGVYRAGDGSYIISSECVSALKSDNMLQIEFEESGNVVCSFVDKRNLESDVPNWSNHQKVMMMQ